MKTLHLAFRFVLVLVAGGQIAAAEPFRRAPLAPAQLEELVSPIALYPDPLVALILPASTNPSDLVLAARYLDRGGDPERAVAEPWDDSVKALARYPEVINYLDTNLAWTRSLGECFLDQPDAVMDAIQMVRVRARASGLLMDTNEQSVIVDRDEIRIVPAQPTVIYVPRYDPEIFYLSSGPVYYPGPFITFGLGCRVGFWLNFDCDWHTRTVRVVQRPDHWYHQPDWRGHHRDEPYEATGWSRWAPPPRHDRRFDRPPHTAELVLRPNRPRDLPNRPRDDDPVVRRRDDDRPDATPNRFHPEPQSGWNGPRRDSGTNPRREVVTERSGQVAPPAPTMRPADQRPPRSVQPAPAVTPPPRVRNDSAPGPARDYRPQPSVRPEQANPSPRVTTPPPTRTAPTVDARPADSRGDARGGPDRRRAADPGDSRQQQN